MAFEVSREETEKLFKIVKTRIYVYILGDLGAFSGAGRKGATKVSNHGRKSPWGMGRQMYFYYLEWLFVYNQNKSGYLQITTLQVYYF